MAAGEAVKQAVREDGWLVRIRAIVTESPAARDKFESWLPIIAARNRSGVKNGGAQHNAVLVGQLNVRLRLFRILRPRRTRSDAFDYVVDFYNFRLAEFDP